MKLSRITTAVFAASLLATVSVAQKNETLQQDLDALKAQVAAQSKEISELKADKGEAAREASVETEINRLSERLAAGCTVDSKASKITFQGEFRYRSYLEFGQTSGGADRDGWFNDSRVRLGFGYDFSKDVSAYAEVQDHFTYGDNGSSSGTADNTGFGGGGGGGFSTAGPGGSVEEGLQLYQAWVKVSNLFGRSEFSTKMGRQEIVLGNQFQFGNADYYNGLTFDGCRWDWSAENFDLTGMWLRTATDHVADSNQSPSYGPFSSVNSDGHDNDEFWALYFTLKTIKNHKLDLYWIYANEHIGATRNSFSSPQAFGSSAYFHTLGARIGGTVDVASGLDWNLEAAYQTGSLSSFGGVDIENLAIEGEVGIMFDKDNRLRVWIRGLYAEGPDTNETGYLPLFPNRHSNTANFHARYGAMDVFPMTDIFALTGGVHFDPSKDWTVGLTGVWGETDTDNSPFADDAYGFEVDVWAEYRYSEALTFSAGVAFLFPDDQLDNASSNLFTPFDGDTQFLFWLQARLFF